MKQAWLTSTPWIEAGTQRTKVLMSALISCHFRDPQGVEACCTPPLSRPPSLCFCPLGLIYFLFFSLFILLFESIPAPLSPGKEVMKRNHRCLFLLCLSIPRANCFPYQDKEAEKKNALKSTSHRQAFNKNFINSTLALGELASLQRPAKEAGPAAERNFLSPLWLQLPLIFGNQSLVVVVSYHTVIIFLFHSFLDTATHLPS